MLESDIFFNTRYAWAINGSIVPGEDKLGDLQAHDLQAIATHEFGHLLGLLHVSDDGNPNNGNESMATMDHLAARGEMEKQTLSPGDIAGAQAVQPGT